MDRDTVVVFDGWGVLGAIADDQHESRWPDRVGAADAALAIGGILARRWTYTTEEGDGGMLLTPELDDEDRPPDGFVPVGWAVGTHEFGDPPEKDLWFRQFRIFGRGGMEFTRDFRKAKIIGLDKRNHANYWAKRCDGWFASVWQQPGEKAMRFFRRGYE